MVVNSNYISDAPDCTPAAPLKVSFQHVNDNKQRFVAIASFGRAFRRAPCIARGFAGMA